eukprot:GHVU01112812.1.p1 GENE.GHVU01112812.1~~GHVU01112812.1.p1  ORF type:complete len:135 (+),score=3.17 GHVU01112812.1:470-874(+)
MLTPYPGTRLPVERDTYNYYTSQLRIRIEQAFGMMVTKWRVFRSPLAVKLRNVGRVINTAARLHNYCIAARCGVAPVDIEPVFATRTGTLGYVPSEHGLRSVPGYSALRARIVEQIHSQGMRRPQWNIQRNAGT